MSNSQYEGLLSPCCGKKTRVVDSRPKMKDNLIWRRRKCTKCAKVFDTEERVAKPGLKMIYVQADKVNIND